MFRGVNILNLDAKGRIAIPTRYRDQIVQQCASRLVITIDRDHCLLVYPLPEWEEIERKLVKLPSLNRQARNMRRLLIGNATESDMDAQGRVLLSSPLRKFAQLDKKVALIGQGNKFELWNEQAWNEKCEAWSEQEQDGEELPPELESLSL